MEPTGHVGTFALDAVSIPERVWWFVEPAMLGESARSPFHPVSIPERVWWFVEPIKILIVFVHRVSIPERVWWFVEQSADEHGRVRHWFQSLKGFGGLWNVSATLRPCPAQSFVSIPERVWWFVEPLFASIFSAPPNVSIPERVWWFVERSVPMGNWAPLQCFNP